MREYSTPALVQISDSANLTDIVFKRAADEPNAVALRRKEGVGFCPEMIFLAGVTLVPTFHVFCFCHITRLIHT